MNRFSFYALLLLIFFVISKIYHPVKDKSNIKKKEDITRFVKTIPSSIIVENVFRSGFIFNTYYVKLKILPPDNGIYRTIVIKTPLKLWQYYSQRVGMSVFQRLKKDQVSFTSQAPGILFVGHHKYGFWKKGKDGSLRWKFYRIYRDMPKELGWNSFQPTIDNITKLRKNKTRDNKILMSKMENKKERPLDFKNKLSLYAKELLKIELNYD